MKRWEDEAREHVRSVLEEALRAVAPQVLLRERVRAVDGALEVRGRRIALGRGALRLAAVGKAARGLAAHADLWERWDERVVVAPDRTPLEGFEVHVGGHPLPTEESVRAGRRLLELADATGPEDTLVLLVSGGGSAMAEVPEVPLHDFRDATRLLLAAGADIHETNAVRKHLSGIKGGRLAARARGRVLALLVSDVPGDDPSTIASGPAAPDPTTYADALEVLHRRHVAETVPPSVREALEAGARGERPETPKTLPNAESVVLAGNVDAADAAHRRAKELGYRVVRGTLGGEARLAGAEVARRALAEASTGGNVALVLGGETTVTVRGRGKGGRNQELALAAVEPISGKPVALASVGTDGIDGPTDAAGAIADGRTLARAEALGLSVAESLAENDAYRFFDALGDLVRTGPTGTNVADLCVALVAR